MNLRVVYRFVSTSFLFARTWVTLEAARRVEFIHVS